VLLVLAVLLTIISFELINNSVRLGIYARRFIIHTMKLVGASWGFIRRPFIVSAVVTGLIAALIANGVLACCFYAIQSYQALTWFDFAIVGVSVLVFGIAITTLCTFASVNKYLRMKAGELYKI
jgi:cell division transport system permease protein